MLGSKLAESCVGSLSVVSPFLKVDEDSSFRHSERKRIPAPTLLGKRMRYYNTGKSPVSSLYFNIQKTTIQGVD